MRQQLLATTSEAKPVTRGHIRSSY